MDNKQRQLQLQKALKQREIEKKKKRPGLLSLMLMKNDLQGYVSHEGKEISSEFVVMKHKAKRAGLHYDLRFKIPGSNDWDSFAVPKGIPLEAGKRVLAVRTTIHSRDEALFTGTIESGYGAGKLTKWDGGRCLILKYSTPHISIIFKGSKVKGLYHLINTGIKDKKSEGKQYLLFKGKE